MQTNLNDIKYDFVTGNYNYKPRIDTVFGSPVLYADKLPVEVYELSGKVMRCVTGYKEIPNFSLASCASFNKKFPGYSLILGEDVSPKSLLGFGESSIKTFSFNEHPYFWMNFTPSKTQHKSSIASLGVGLMVVSTGFLHTNLDMPFSFSFLLGMSYIALQAGINITGEFFDGVRAGNLHSGATDLLYGENANSRVDELFHGLERSAQSFALKQSLDESGLIFDPLIVESVVDAYWGNEAKSPRELVDSISRIEGVSDIGVIIERLVKTEEARSNVEGLIIDWAA